MQKEEYTTGVARVLEEIKKYFSLQKDYARLVLVEKLALLLSAMVLFLIIMLLSLIGGFYLLVAVQAWLEPVFGRALSSMMLVGVVLICILFVYFLRERLINKPVLRFVAKLLLLSSSKDRVK